MTMHQQKRFIFWGVVLPTLVLCVFLGRWVYGQECVQSYVDSPAWADANAVDGILLPPYPGDPNTWEARVGFFQRDPAMACDPNDDPFKIECIEWTTDEMPIVNHDTEAGLWWFSVFLTAGTHRFLFEADDRRPDGRQRYTILLKTTANSPPVLY